MTYHLRHHTEQLHRKAAKCVPAQVYIPDIPGAEEWLAGKVRDIIAGSAPRSNTKPNVLQQKIMAVMKDGRERTLSDVFTAIGYSRENGDDPDSVRFALQKLTDAGVIARENLALGRSHIAIYTLAHEPHVSCKDRIAAAVKEAAQ